MSDYNTGPQWDLLGTYFFISLLLTINQGHQSKGGRVHTTSSIQKAITFYDYFRRKKYDLFMTSAIFLCRGLMFSNDVTH